MLLRCECQAVYVYNDNLPKKCQYCSRKLGDSLTEHAASSMPNDASTDPIDIAMSRIAAARKAEMCAACRTELRYRKDFAVHRARGCEAKAIEDVLSGRLPFGMVCSDCSEGFEDFDRHLSVRHPDYDQEKVKARYMCQFCPARLDNARDLARHTLTRHAVCPEGGEYFATAAEREEHQRKTGHYYCDEHDLFFVLKVDFDNHKRFTAHTAFGCVDCDMAFNSQDSLDAHLASEEHKASTLVASLRTEAARKAALVQTITALEDINLWCERCDRVFTSLAGLQGHRKSIKHNPLSELSCPLSKSCRKIFLSPSALLNHLESGSCKSGIDLNKLNALVHAHDTDRHITKAENLASVLVQAETANDIHSLPATAAVVDKLGLVQGQETNHDDEESVISVEDDIPTMTPSSLSRTSSFSGGIVLTPSATLSRASSFGGGVLLTPPSSSIGLSARSDASGVMLTPAESSMTGSCSALVQNGSTQRTWPCIVPGCRKKFTSKAALMLHLSSLAHAPEL